MPMPKPPKFSDSFTTQDACFSVDVEVPHGESREAVVVKIDCAGSVHGDEGLIDLLIEMLEGARENLLARRGEAAVQAYWVGRTPRTKRPTREPLKLSTRRSR